jgi:Uma2 family endonuclease
MKAQSLSKLTVQEYIQHEIDTGQKYEYHDGDIYALAGGTIKHALLIGNIYSELRNALRKAGADCKPITGEAKLHIASNNKYLYPDSMVVCGVIESPAAYEEAITNPILVVEVLSKSTKDYDRGDKFFFYRQIHSLQEYVLIDQDRYVVETYYKNPGSDLWRISRYEGLDEVLQLQSISIDIKMSDLYFDIKIEDQ